MNLTSSALTFGLQAFMTLFVILDPPGVTPIFLSLVSDVKPKHRIRLAWLASAVSLGVIVIFALFGKFILNYLHVSIYGLQGAGGLLLLLVSLELLMGWGNSRPENGDKNVALVPIGTPLLAGPGAIVATMIYVGNAHTTDKKIAVGIAIIAVHAIIGFTLMASTKILKVLKESGINLLARIAGLLLAAIAFQMIIESINGFFNLGAKL
jgi:multiple antibiotic resistance protein